MAVFKENNKAIYLQIADRLCDEVLLGHVRDGDRIPSVREYAASLEVNANTVMRSYEHLERLGVIFNRRGIGFFIADGAWETIVVMRRENFVNGGEMHDFFRQMMLLGIKPDDVRTMYENYLKTEEK